MKLILRRLQTISFVVGIIFTFSTIQATVEHVCERFKVHHPSRNFPSNQVQEWARHDENSFEYISTVIPECLAHTGTTGFDSHLKGVQSILRTFGAKSDVCDAGLFHSIYGTEGFQGFKLPLSNRPAIRKLIGERAERLVWIFCMVDRYTFDQTLYILPEEQQQTHRKFELFSRPELGRFPIILKDEEEWLDFMELTLTDWLEQVEGAALKVNPLFEWSIGEAWSYRRQAYKNMVEILLQRRLKSRKNINIIKDTYEAIYAVEEEQTKHLHQIKTPPMSQAAREARDALQYINT